MEKSELRIFAVGALVVSVFIYYQFIKKPWMISIHKENKTVMRLNYSSLEKCSEAGGELMREDKTIDRFTCSFKCRVADKNDMSRSPICKKICDAKGCR